MRHELQHCETMRQTMAHRRAAARPASRRLAPCSTGGDGLARAARRARSRWARGRRAFAYDNERPRHDVEAGAFQIARRPVSNASWMHFSEGGGYERREWWSDEGWAWKEEYDITHHPAVAAGHAARRPPATSPGSRPTPSPERTSAPAHARPSGRGRRPGTRGLGEHRTSVLGARVRCAVWEWTASRVPRLPGLPRLPLSRVLRGVLRRATTGCCAAARGRPTRAWRRSTFRNWDLPQRRQIFAGRAPGEGRVMEPLPSAGAARARRSGSTRTSTAAEERSLADDVLDGLTRPFKELPPKHFYDARGAELFDRICELPEYYPTRTERAILERARAGARRAHRRGRARRARLGHGGQDARAARRAARRGHARALRARRRHREHGARLRRGAHRASTRGCACTA